MEEFDYKRYVEDNDRYTFVVIHIYDRYTVEVFKSRNLQLEGRGMGMFCQEGEHYGGVGGCSTEILPNGFKETIYDDGHMDETYMFNTKDKQGLLDAQKVLQNISTELKTMKSDIDDYSNFLWCEWCDRGRIERNS